jgi:hypothetical protein
MGALPQALEIIFEEVQRKRNNEKIIIRRKISFPTYKMCFLFSSL